MCYRLSALVVFVGLLIYVAAQRRYEASSFSSVATTFRCFRRLLIYAPMKDQEDQSVAVATEIPDEEARRTQPL